jgi:hypothetical protein
MVLALGPRRKIGLKNGKIAIVGPGGVDCCDCEDEPANCCGCPWLESYYQHANVNRIRVSFSGALGGFSVLDKTAPGNHCYRWDRAENPDVTPPNFVREIAFACGTSGPGLPGDIQFDVALGGATCGVIFTLDEFSCDEDEDAESNVLRAVFRGTLFNSSAGDCAGLTGDEIIAELTNDDPWPPP